MKKDKTIEWMRQEIKKSVKYFSEEDLKLVKERINSLKDDKFVDSLNESEVLRYFALVETVIKRKGK